MSMAERMGHAARWLAEAALLAVATRRGLHWTAALLLAYVTAQVEFLGLLVAVSASQHRRLARLEQAAQMRGEDV